MNSMDRMDDVNQMDLPRTPIYHHSLNLNPNLNPNLNLNLNLLLALLLILLYSSPVFSQLDPQSALQKMKVSDGLDVSLFASEPDVLNPTSIDIDSLGRVWVCEAVNYRIFHNPTVRPEGDRIRVLEDTDHDGKCDKATTFYQDKTLQSPLGIAVLGSRVYVTQSPDVFYLEDTDGDGVADKKTVILTGFKGIDHDHAIHGIIFGHDGKLYMSNGDQGLDVTDKSGHRVWVGKDAPYGGGCVLRTDLEGEHLELIADGFRNPMEPTMDSFGNIFISDNDDDGNQQCRICYVMEGGNYGYWPKRNGDRHLDAVHWNEDRPGVVPKILKTGFGSPVGLMYYEGDLLPEYLRRTMLHADAGPGVVRSYTVTPKGAGFSAEMKTVLSCPDDSWFRPVDVCAAPDGSVFVADWYDPGVGGHNLRDWTRGRIYRLAPPKTVYKPSKANVATPENAKRALMSSNQATRFLAYQSLKSQVDSKAGLNVSDLLASKNPVVRARILWLYRDSGETARPIVGRTMDDGDPRFRVQAIRLLNTGVKMFSSGSGTNSGAEPRNLFAALKLFGDSDASVRREVLLALAKEPDESLSTVAIPKLIGSFDGNDRYYREAIGIAFRGREEKYFDEIFKSTGQSWTKPYVEVAFELHPPSAIKIASRVLEDPSRPIGEKLDAIRIISAGNAEQAAPALIAQLKEESPKEIATAVLKLLATDSGGAWSALKDKPELRAYLRSAIQKDELRPAVLDLIEQDNMVEMVPDLLAIAQNPQNDKAQRLDALHAAGEMRASDTLDPLKLLLGDPDPEIASAAAEGLGGIKGNDALEILRAALADLTKPREVRKAVVRSLGATKSGTLLILKTAEAGELPADLTLDATTAAHASPFDDIRLMADQLLPQEQTKEGKALPPISELIKMQGDPAKGHDAFYMEDGPQCFKCHRIAGEGREVGPDLSKIGGKLAREGIFESILNPSAAISHEYEVWIINTKSRGYLNGYIRAEIPGGIELVDSEGKTTKITTSDILDRTKSAISLMPTGLSAGLTTQQLVDLTAFLSTLK